MITILKFTDDELQQANVAINSYKLMEALYEIQQYAHLLQKYEERESIPTSEIVDKLNDLLVEYYKLRDD
jgi:hypothetical protein